MRSNVDTDLIIRIEPLTQQPREELGRFAFESIRYAADGSENPQFVLNRPQFRNAKFLLAGENFGCGSSREGAVWALMGLGLRCVIAPSFGDIFKSNCFQNGFLPIELDKASIVSLAADADRGSMMTVDLTQQRLTTDAGTSHSFIVDEMGRQALLEGLDAIQLTLRDSSQITAWQHADRKHRPWVWNIQSPAATLTR